MKNKIQTQSVITCPKCGQKEEETMPTNSCQFFYTCKHCNHVLRPKEGDCCVFCSYGSSPCPPVQEQNKRPVKTKSSWGSITGSFGILTALLPALMCPACWPAYAALLGSLGIEFINYTPILLGILIFLFSISIGHMLYQTKTHHHQFGPSVVALLAALGIIAGKIFVFFLSTTISYLSIIAFAFALLWNRRLMKSAECNRC